ncbi:kinase-like domain-containing protein [Rhizophagus irregularis DAOM 181602=DAOM 197198]|nr:kinase-like domain-containing protein [Rhizophagus irregularis DAOM 181602=DAOM 197198]
MLWRTGGSTCIKQSLWKESQITSNCYYSPAYKLKGDCFEDDNYEEDNHNKESELALRFKELEYWEND